MIDLNMEDLVQTESIASPKIDWKDLFVGKIEKNSSITIRPVVNYDSPLYYKNVPVHEYLKGVGSSVCINTKDNLTKGIHCPFCTYIVQNLSAFYKQMEPLLQALGYSFSDVKTFKRSLGDCLKTRPKGYEAIKALADEANRYEMLSYKAKSFLPVIDRSNPHKIKLFSHGTSVRKSLELISKAGKDITTADIIITNTGTPPQYYSVMRDDPKPFTTEEQALIQRELPEREKILSSRYGDSAKTPEAINSKFEKFQDALAKAAQAMALPIGAIPASAPAPKAEFSSDAFVVAPH